MGISTWPVASSGSAIKSVQRGSAAGAGNVTITSVDTTKSFVNVFGTASSGTVAASGSTNTFTGNFPQTDLTIWQGGGSTPGTGLNSVVSYGLHFNAQTMNMNSSNLTGGTNNLVAAVAQGYLSNATTLVVSGACRWEVVEFN